MTPNVSFLFPTKLLKDICKTKKTLTANNRETAVTIFHRIYRKPLWQGLSLYSYKTGMMIMLSTTW